MDDRADAAGRIWKLGATTGTAVTIPNTAHIPTGTAFTLQNTMPPSYASERGLTAGSGIRVVGQGDGLTFGQPDLPTRLRAFAAWLAGNPVPTFEAKARLVALVDGVLYQPVQQPVLMTPAKELAPMAAALMRVMRLLCDHTLSEATAATALRDVLDEHVPEPAGELVEREISCGLCRRVFCKVQTREGMWALPRCPGCALEGRV